MSRVALVTGVSRRIGIGEGEVEVLCRFVARSEGRRQGFLVSSEYLWPYMPQSLFSFCGRRLATMYVPITPMMQSKNHSALSIHGGP